MVGLLTLLALSFYQAPVLLARAKTSLANLRLARDGSSFIPDSA